jgi:LPS sulfotransferase NodH
MRDHETRFVVFTTQRTGSTWLMSVLNNVDGVSAQGELFLPRPRSQERRWDSDFAWPRYVESREKLGSRRPFSVFRYLTALYESPGSVGFKLMYSQLKSFPEILPFLVREKIDVIHLVRRNHIDVLISFALKRQIGRAHVLSAAERPEDEKVELDTRSLVQALLDFMHIPFDGGPPESAILKTRTGSQREVLANYDEVRRALAGSRFSSLLD